MSVRVTQPVERHMDAFHLVAAAFYRNRIYPEYVGGLCLLLHQSDYYVEKGILERRDKGA